MNCCMLQLEQVSLASFCQFQWFLYACLLLLRPAVSLLFGFHFSQFMFMGPLYHSSRTWITFCSFFFYVLVWFWSIGTIFSITDILSLCILTGVLLWPWKKWCSVCTSAVYSPRNDYRGLSIGCLYLFDYYHKSQSIFLYYHCYALC